MAYRKDIRRTQSSFAIGKTTENATSLKIISDDLCGRNGLKSKVSTLEELYDFFKKILKNYIADVIFGAGDILSPGSLY